MTFETALAKTLGFEGGTSDHALDRGGLTKWGVTQVAYSGWRQRQNLPSRAVTEMTEPEMRALYREDYWLPAGCDKLPDELGEVVFDMAVNSGPKAAIRALQRALRILDDGIMGPATISAAHEAGPYVALHFLKERAALYRDIVKRDPGQVAFLSGWINRLLDQAWRMHA